jgi:tRNA-binding protein
MATFQGFQNLDIRIGTVVSAEPHPKSRKPSIQLRIDFGGLGIKQSSAQLTTRYTPDDLIGRQVVAVIPPIRVGGFKSEVLVLGAMESATDVVLLTLDQPVENGTQVA